MKARKPTLWLVATELLALGCGPLETVYLHPSTEVNISGNRVAFAPSGSSQQSSQASQPKLVLIGQTPTGTFRSDPVAINMGLMVQFAGYYEPPGCHRVCVDPALCQGVPDESQIVCDGGSPGLKNGIYLDFLYRQFGSELSTQPDNEAEVKVADVEFSEYAAKISLFAGDIKKIGLGILGSFMFGYAHPHIARNYGYYPNLDAKGSTSCAIGFELTYDFASWLYAYAPFFLGWTLDPHIRFTTETTTFTSNSFGYLPTYAGIGLGVGFRIPVKRF
jgi:hypothetical protein